MKINSRDISQLDDEVAELVRETMSRCKNKGIDLLVTSTYRNFASQNDLYAQGRTRSGPRVTNARAGQSWHNWRRAVDFVILVNGKPSWKTTGIEGKMWETMGEIGESVGLEWAGRWTRFREFPHFQLIRGLTLASLQKQYPQGLPHKRSLGEIGGSGSTLIETWFDWETLA